MPTKRINTQMGFNFLLGSMTVKTAFITHTFNSIKRILNITYLISYFTLYVQYV